MDAADLAQTIALLAIVMFGCRYGIATFTRAGEGIATLFVPPDRTLGWPRGVQEGDEPWGWRPAQVAASLPLIGRDRADDDLPPGERIPLVVPAGSFMVPVGPVKPVHLAIRSHAGSRLH